jgi:hypothetical protein
MASPSRSLLEGVATDALEYLRHEHRLGSLPNIPWDDVNFALGIVLAPTLTSWRPDGGTEFRSYLLISVKRRCYRHLFRETPSCGDQLLDTIQGDASESEPELPPPPSGPLGEVVRAYIATYRAGDPPTPANLAMASGMPMRDVMRLLPLVRPWLRSGAIGSPSNGGISRREPKGGERCRRPARNQRTGSNVEHRLRTELSTALQSSPPESVETVSSSSPRASESRRGRSTSGPKSTQIFLVL